MKNFITISMLIFPLFADVDYETEIQPIFSGNCGGCHISSSSAGLNLSSYEGVMAGSNNGMVVIPFDHAASELYDRITRPESAAGDMPPSGSLSQSQIDLIADWIDEGAQPCIIGCTDPEAINYDPEATCGDDVSCTYPEDVDYESEIQPIFTNNCGSCHISNSYAGLNLSSYDNVMAGSNSGAVIIPGDYQASLLWQQVDNGTMPPGTATLSPIEVSIIAIWITEGALPEPGACALPGDISGDLNLNVLDVVQMVNLILGLGDIPPCADMNDDGNLNVLDVVLLVNAILEG